MMTAHDRYAAFAPLMARSSTVPPGKNSGRTTQEPVENAGRAPPGDTSAGSRRPAGVSLP